MKTALITGASDGIGKDMAIILSNMGYNIIVVARNQEKMKKTFKNIKNCLIIPMDLSIQENCYKLYNITKDKDIEILINNAGYGIFGQFLNTNLNNELNMIDLNIKSLHILTKLFLKDMVKKDKGYILNVGSIGSFFASPLLSSYYGSKAYVLNLSIAIKEELKKQKSNVYIGVFCPATINTNFHKKAGAKGKVKGLDSYTASKYAIDKMFKKRTIIIPSYANLLPFFIGIIPKTLITKIAYNIQIKKQ
ncbi:SDR family NAD(P)-dependent oxidoreductase [uncultured Tyzzerella sp.]|uniref:SDR family NAD(P)-dependent oxidoreductase n=1 Tax=uncultured Tyzzerella sp. TaxID=2321398 RepID=UPI00294386A1|nr:SDR family NAD(P)-dependent oxidoreductase [uncultured Tyzzerella sp.]